MVENVEFLNRLRNGHLEKSAVTGVRRPSRSPKTAKRPAKVHLRLRFQNLGKPRTAQAVTILLMLTGGAPGSTAGGMKVTTLAVLIANAAAVFHRREDSRLFDRRLDYSAIRNAAAILLLYLSLTFVGAAVISEVEGLPLGACLYETASAAGTVGLTLGLTPHLGTLSQSILILLMFFGRVGGLTLIYAAFSGHDLTYARYPKEMITVG